ncbi:hypothetical protein ACWEJ6_23575 [Nonomuraea sp. NPDC004702]
MSTTCRRVIRALHRIATPARSSASKRKRAAVASFTKWAVRGW